MSDLEVRQLMLWIRREDYDAFRVAINQSMNGVIYSADFGEDGQVSHVIVTVRTLVVGKQRPPMTGPECAASAGTAYLQAMYVQAMRDWAEVELNTAIKRHNWIASVQLALPVWAAALDQTQRERDALREAIRSVVDHKGIDFGSHLAWKEKWDRMDALAAPPATSAGMPMDAASLAELSRTRPDPDNQEAAGYRYLSQTRPDREPPASSAGREAGE